MYLTGCAIVGYVIELRQSKKTKGEALRFGRVLVLWTLMAMVGAAVAAEQAWDSFAREKAGQVALSRGGFLISQKAAWDLRQDRPDVDRFEKILDEMAGELRDRIAGAAAGGSGGVNRQLEAMGQYLFEEKGFEVDSSPHADAFVENVLLHEVLERRKGVCLSLSMIYLALAERLRIPLYGVSVPTHFFVRYDDGKTRRNIEMLDGGRIDRPDKFFTTRYFVREDEVFYMENLDPHQVLAVFLSNLASVYVREKKPKKAIALLDVAREVNPRDVEAITNTGAAYYASGEQDRAAKFWLDSARLSAYDDEARYYLAKYYYFKADYEQAIHFYDEALLLGHEVDYPLLRALEPHREDSLHRKDMDGIESEKKP